MTRTALAKHSFLPTAVYLIGAAGLLVFANGRWVLWPAAWLAPVFLLLFLESRPRVSGLSIGFLLQVAAFFINWKGMIPVPGAWYYLVAGIYAFFYYLPFVLHRVVAPRLVGFASTLVLPSAWVAIELIFQKLITPYGSWASIAYTQVDQQLLLQLAAIAGTGGVSFVVLWSASVIAWVWSNRARFSSLRPGLAVYALVMALVLAWGGYRLMSARQSLKTTVQAAGITPSSRLENDLMSVMGRVRSGAVVNEQAAMASLEERAARLNDDLLDRTSNAAADGAELIVWSEHAARVLPQTEDALVEDAAAVARNRGAGIILGIGLWDPAATPPFENKLTAIEPDGSVAWTYHKARPIAGNEAGLIAKGTAQISILDADFGRIGVVICHDLDFPEFVRSAGRRGVDVLIGPSNDWSEIAIMHHRMAVLRAVENGVTLFRPCKAGISSVVDPFGRVIETAVENGEEGLSFNTQVPVYDVASLYPILGDWCGYASGGLIVLLILFGFRRPEKSRGPAS